MTAMLLRVYIITVMVALLLLTTVEAALAQFTQENLVAGVKPGDSFTYTATGTYPGELSPQSIPPEVLSAQATQFYRITILNVTGPEIGYAYSWQFNNGSNPIEGESRFNVETTENSGGFWPIVAANITASERLYPHYAPDLRTFNETIKYTYSNYTRETNKLELQFAEQSNVTQAVRVVHSNAYFDKLTGMLVRLDDETNYQNPTYTTTFAWILAGQTAWTYASAGSSPPESFFSLPVIIAIAVVVAIVVVIGGWFVAKKRRDARRKQLLRKK